MIDDLKPRFGGVIVHPAEVDQVIESRVGVVMEKTADGKNILRPDLQGGLAPEGRGAGDRLREFLFRPFHNFFQVHTSYLSRSFSLPIFSWSFMIP